MKIALVSTGLGRVLRGFESFTDSLFQALRRYAPEVDVTLYQGGGQPGPRRMVVPNFHRYDFPARCFGYEKGNLLEKRSFALALYPLIRAGKFDIIHYNELVMGSALCHLRRIFGGRYKLLYCAGSTWSPAHYGHRCDFAQLLTRPMYEQAQGFGIPDERLFLIPYGVNDSQFSPQVKVRRSETRRELGIPEEATIVLSVALLDRGTKRIDYLIRELSDLQRPLWLVVAGQRTHESDSLEREANRLLNGRCRFVSWPREKVQFLYGAADLFVLTSLVEAFGLVTIEAMLSGLPVVIHNAPVFKWISEGTSAILTDMSIEGNLRDIFERVFAQAELPSSRAVVAGRFAWQRLVPQYVRMYEQVEKGQMVC